MNYREVVINVLGHAPALKATLWRMVKTYNRTKRWLIDGRPTVDGNSLLKTAVLESKPCAAGKMGSVEVDGFLDYIKREKMRKANRFPKDYRPDISRKLFLNAGVFPETPDSFDRFYVAYLDALSQCDLLASWDVPGEAEALNCYCKFATLIKLASFEAYLSTEPWTAALKGKRVLVISPFVDSIRAQYAHRHDLWDDPNVLPSFELHTIRAPFSAGLVPPKDCNWSSAVSRMEEEMDLLDYDVAIIGAGAFSLPLAVHAKHRGKVGVHLGGPTQILFGIKGDRWQKFETIRCFFKDSWVRPMKEETPSSCAAIENGCYW